MGNGCPDFTRESLALEVERSMEHRRVRPVAPRAGSNATVALRQTVASSSPTARNAGSQRGARIETAYIAPGSPWENAYMESFNGKLRDELLNREVVY
jgi:putative transposase